MNECGGCAGTGRHKRWCPAVVGPSASQMGRLSVEAESLGDRIGPNEMGAANLVWQAASRLRARAEELAEEYMAQKGTHH